MRFEDLKIGDEFIEVGKFHYYIYTVKSILNNEIECTNGAIKSRFCIENDCNHILDLSCVRDKIMSNKIEYYKDLIIKILVEDDLDRNIMNEEYECLRLAVDKAIIENRRRIINEKK